VFVPPLELVLGMVVELVPVGKVVDVDVDVELEED
jgi:hypothetical protein